MPEKVDFERYKLTDVAVNDGTGEKPCWIIIKDSVYDVTNYLDDHPGGGELITEWAGRDATKGFDDFGHLGDAKKLLKQLKIGELVEEDKKSNRNNANGKTNQNVYADAVCPSHKYVQSADSFYTDVEEIHSLEVVTVAGHYNKRNE